MRDGEREESYANSLFFFKQYAMKKLFCLNILNNNNYEAKLSLHFQYLKLIENGNNRSKE